MNKTHAHGHTHKKRGTISWLFGLLLAPLFWFFPKVAADRNEVSYTNAPRGFLIWPLIPMGMLLGHLVSEPPGVAANEPAGWAALIFALFFYLVYAYDMDIWIFSAVVGVIGLILLGGYYVFDVYEVPVLSVIWRFLTQPGPSNFTSAIVLASRWALVWFICGIIPQIYLRSRRTIHSRGITREGRLFFPEKTLGSRRNLTTDFPDLLESILLFGGGRIKSRGYEDSLVIGLKWYQRPVNEVIRRLSVASDDPSDDDDE